jgi:hypothetical protein
MKKNNLDYDLYLPYWKQIRVFKKGMNDVQDYIQGVTKDTSPVGITRNREYKARGIYTNFTSVTVEALQGAVFRKAMNVEIPSKLEYLIDNANGARKTLEHVAKNTISNLIEVGRHGLFADYGTQAKIVTYTAENVRDWETDEAGILTKVVLITGSKQEKHLLIGQDGKYIVEFYKDDEESPYRIDEPKKFDGSRFDYIPFVFCGSVDNAPDVDLMPMWSIVNVSRGHFQDSCDLQDVGKYMVPTPWVNVPKMNPKEFIETMLPNGYEFGNGAVIPIPEGGSAGLIQAASNTMHSEMMKEKENQLIMLGARIIDSKGTEQTAYEAGIKFSSQNSILDNLVSNCEQAMTFMLECCAEFEGVSDAEIVFKMNRDYFDRTLSAQDITAEIMLLDRGVKAMQDVRGTLRKVGNIEMDRTDEDIDGSIEIEAPRMSVKPNVV